MMNFPRKKVYQRDIVDDYVNESIETIKNIVKITQIKSKN
jgi:uncharacterized metal-binding protein